MIKLTGAVCVLLGALLIWLADWRERTRQREILSDLRTACFRLGEEIRVTRAPISKLLARLAADSGPDAALFFHTVSEAAKAAGSDKKNNNSDMDFPAAWKDAAACLPLEERDMRRLMEISGDLRGDEERIRKALAAAGEYFSGRLAEAEQSARDDARRTAALSLSGGALLVILLY